MRMFLSSTDTKTSHLTEDVARRISRRDIVLKGVKGMAASVAALSVGGMAAARGAFALVNSCACSYPGCGSCSCLGYTCPSTGCPSACRICTSVDCPGTQCIYSGGSWIVQNCVCGHGGYGYYRCYDCRCTSCSRLCGCRSMCFCAGCRSAADVRAQIARDEELALAG
jgi:hypothetical protein